MKKGREYDRHEIEVISKSAIGKSINDILYLIYSSNKKSIISYDLSFFKKINEIKNAHEEYISNFKYYLDKINKIDLILSISSFGNDIKLWNINNFECICHIKNINNNFISACLIKENNFDYIITTGSYNAQIKIFNINGTKINEINNSNEISNFIDSYYDNKLFKYYIITGNDGYVKTYDFTEKKCIIYMRMIIILLIVV